jgi:ribosomal protein S18 acetylase RimI-like enzyme
MPDDSIQRSDKTEFMSRILKADNVMGDTEIAKALTIRPLLATDIPDVVALHIRTFDSTSGRRFLERAFYPTMLHPASTGFSFVQVSGAKVVGFIVGARSISIWHRSLLRKYGWECIWAAFRVCASGWGGINQVASPIRFLSSNPQYGSGALIFHLAVNEAYRGYGLASELTKTVLDFCRSQGLHRCWTRALKTNVAAHRLYKRLDFQLHKKLSNYEKIRFVYFYDFEPSQKT